ncbi:flavin reductase (NADPH)-like [Scleropages formosus]|uniref:Flavin reductase (NADPH)-like n=1 Tax=Scleropages formosus TaxID=113540 RepID=A0A0P7WV51_SCLFO|nr:flavin reductase (NADPH)-like [Scleropages formosus]
MLHPHDRFDALLTRALGRPQVVEGDIFSEESLRGHFREQDAVVSCLGFSPSWWYGVTGYTASMRAIVGALRDARVTRLVAMTSWYTDPKEFLTHEGYFVPDANGNPVGNSVARGDVARFMLSLLSSNAWFRKAVAVTTK